MLSLSLRGFEDSRCGRMRRKAALFFTDTAQRFGFE
jgi:hypothetical protein